VLGRRDAVVGYVTAGEDCHGELSAVHTLPLGDLGQQRVAGRTAGVCEHQHEVEPGSEQVLEPDHVPPEQMKREPSGNYKNGGCGERGQLDRTRAPQRIGDDDEAGDHRQRRVTHQGR
jgi:hypothetical protein